MVEYTWIVIGVSSQTAERLKGWNIAEISSKNDSNSELSSTLIRAIQWIIVIKEMLYQTGYKHLPRLPVITASSNIRSIIDANT